ncbi:MAG TPA: nitroreductase family protein [Limnochordia bacterium]|nr:nitroreductase family protein [Limnochordia bacterium]
MTFIDLVAERYSLRKFSEKVVEKEKILQILEAARLAPSAVNYQPYHFIVITDQALKAKVAEAYSREWFARAPVVIVACGDHNTSWKRQDGKDHVDLDVAIAVDHLTLAAVELGLGTCWVCAFDAVHAHNVLELPEHLEVVALIPLGYPLDDSRPLKKRRDLAEFVSWNGYNL